MIQYDHKIKFMSGPHGIVDMWAGKTRKQYFGITITPSNYPTWTYNSNLLNVCAIRGINKLGHRGIIYLYFDTISQIVSPHMAITSLTIDQGFKEELEQAIVKSLDRCVNGDYTA